MSERETSELPHRPLLKPWYRLLHRGDRSVLEYGQSVVLFEGRAAGSLLPVLFPLLDGTRTLEDISALIGQAARPAVEKALVLLARHGVLTEGPPLDGDTPRPFASAAEFLAATSPTGASPARVRRLLRRARLGIVGACARAEAVARLLRLSGLARLEPLSWTEAEGSLASLDLALAVPAASELPRLEEWNRSALRARVPWLQLLPFDGRYAAVGPLYVPGETCCYQCFRLRRASNLDYEEEFWALEQQRPAHPAAPFVEQIVAGLGVRLALGWLVDRDPSIPGAFYAFEQAETLGLSYHTVYRVPRCQGCSGLSQAAAPLPWFEGEG